MKDFNGQICDVWNELSFRRFINRKNERELDSYELAELYDFNEDEIGQYGLYEDITLKNCSAVEDYWDIISEFN